MRAVVMYEPGGLDALKIVDIDRPKPGPGQVLIKVAAAGVDAHDVIVRSGIRKMGVAYHDVTVHRNGGAEHKKAHILGHEISGIVEEIGSQVTTVKPGDRVACKQLSSCGICKLCRSGNETRCNRFVGNEGGYAEYVAINEDGVVKVPDDIDLKTSAMFACAIGTALHAVKAVGKVQIGENVLVTGASGGVGIHALQLCKSAGARVITVTSSPDKAPFLKQYGADEVISAPDLNFHEQVKELTDGEGVDVVVDCVGAPTFPSGFRSIAKAGRYLFVGAIDSNEIHISPALIFRKAISIHGPASTTRQELKDVFTLVQRKQVKPVFAGEYALEEAAIVHKLLEERKITGRALLVPSIKPPSPRAKAGQKPSATARGAR